VAAVGAAFVCVCARTCACAPVRYVSDVALRGCGWLACHCGCGVAPYAYAACEVDRRDARAGAAAVRWVGGPGFLFHGVARQ
jgi:hypothetical protein